jgi:hypothetical protein
LPNGTDVHRGQFVPHQLLISSAEREREGAKRGVGGRERDRGEERRRENLKTVRHRQERKNR